MAEKVDSVFAENNFLTPVHTHTYKSGDHTFDRAEYQREADQEFIDGMLFEAKLGSLWISPAK